MRRRVSVAVLLLTDFLSICMAWLAYYLLRVRSGLIEVPVEPDFWQPMIIVYLFWLLVYWVVGLYRPWYAASRFDEIALVFKTTIFGCLFLFFAIFVDDAGQPSGISSRVLILLYGAMLFGFVGGGRLILRSIQRHMLIAGIGVQNTVIVGSAARSRELYQEVLKFPALGYKVVGFVRLERRRSSPDEKSVPVLGSVDDLPRILGTKQIRDVLIALDSQDHSRLLEIIAGCSRHNVGLKIVPDLYDIISGQARTNQIHGFPLIEISPQLMPPWEEAAKRMLDVTVASCVLFLALPLWLLIAVAIRLESSGPALYKQERVGKDGVHFRIFKFRSMRQDAEKAGPQWAHKRDTRVTRVGRVLRKLHLDEVPQMINVMRGQMSLVGPRPERPVFVDQLTEEIPMYPRRLKVRPGITGWAQVKHKYDETIDDVRKKVEYDFFYIENMSLRMDFKILLSTVYHMLLWRGR